MSFPRFLHPESSQSGCLASGDVISLSTEEAHHLAHVLRLEVGDRIEVVDGRGALAVGEIVTVGKQGAKVRLEAVSTHAPISKVTVAFGLPKPAALEFILRRATEVGVAAFQPLVTRHSLRMGEWNDRRWSKIVVEVCKQCQELNFPLLHPPVSLDSWLEQRPSDRELVFFDETDRASRVVIPVGAAGYDILAGPEGGWAPEEIARVRAAGAHSYGLGKNRLRVEMAAVVGAALIKREIGEFY